MNEQIDPTALRLSRAIRQVESGGNYNQSGPSGEKGAYQWMPGNYEAMAKEAGVGPNDFSETAQDKTAYTRIKSLLDKGYSQSQVASLWNSGSPDPTGKVGVNKQGVSYDTPAYVQKVQRAYLSSSADNHNYNPQPFSTGQFDFSGLNQNQEDKHQTDTSSLGGELVKRGKEASGAFNLAGKGITDTFSGKPFAGTGELASGAFQTVGAAAGGLGDVIGAGLGLIPGVKQAEDVIGQGVGALANTDIGQNVIQGSQQFFQDHPILAGDIGAGVNIASLGLGGVGGKLAKTAVERGIYDVAAKGLVGAGAKGLVEKKALSDATKVLSSNATKAEIKNAVRFGRTTVNKGIPGVAADPLKQDSIQEVANLVREGKVSAKALATDNATAIKIAADTEAEQMRNLIKNREVQTLVQPEDIQGLEDRVIKRAGTSATSGENPASTLMKVFKENLPTDRATTAEDILNARQAVSIFVLENKGDWNMRGVLTGFKSARNAFWDESRNMLAELAPDVPVKDMLARQSALYRALDYIVPNVKSEIGTKPLERFAARHPVISGVLKKGIKYGAEGLGIGAGLKILSGD